MEIGIRIIVLLIILIPSNFIQFDIHMLKCHSAFSLYLLLSFSVMNFMKTRSTFIFISIIFRI